MCMHVRQCACVSVCECNKHMHTRAGSRILRVVRPSEQNIRSFSAQQARVSGDKLTRKNLCYHMEKTSSCCQRQHSCEAAKARGVWGHAPPENF